MRRGDLVTIALQGDYGKPRPALIVQSDLFNEHPSVTILPVTSELRGVDLFSLQFVPRAFDLVGCAGTNIETTEDRHSIAE